MWIEDGRFHIVLPLDSGKQRYYDKMKQNSLQPFTYDSRSNQESSRRSQTIQHITQSQEEKQKEERNNGAQDIAQQTTSNTVHHVRRLLLKRDPNDRSVGGNGLGMRVIGGKEIPNSGGKLGTYVTRIYQGGVADKLRVIKEGDRLLEWNGVSLTGKTFEEVQRVVSLSEGKIDIVVESGKPSTSLELSCTSLTTLDKSNYDKIDYNGNKRMLSFEETLNEKHSDEIKKHIRDCGIRTSSSEEREEFEAHTLDTAELHKGEIQLQVCYDKNAQILYVIVKKARNLKCVEGVPPDSLVNVYLLPERINEQQRRTQVLTRTCDPEWNETLVYENVSQDQLISRFLELTVWNYAESTTIKFLGGILIDLTDPNVVTEEARWYALQDGPTLQKSMSNSGSVHHVEESRMWREERYNVGPSLWRGSKLPKTTRTSSHANIGGRILDACQPSILHTMRPTIKNSALEGN
uniref:(California timema) hypothetical protein n=1 Tax=Timema californicum TaxID=61474 RepID=A0A7R9P4P6_TIMCA|nr:unnamed protein product [Timema californicum]